MKQGLLMSVVIIKIADEEMIGLRRQCGEELLELCGTSSLGILRMIGGQVNGCDLDGSRPGLKLGDHGALNA